MGVLGLWDILLTVAQSTQLSQMSGMVVAVDVSIWLVRAASAQLQLKCIFDKIILLRKLNILPIMVFDGVAPALKKNTLTKRRSSHLKQTNDQLKKYAQIQVVKILQGKQVPENKHLKYQCQIDEINNVINTLKSLPGEQVPLEKLQMQSQILRMRYKLLMGDDEQLLPIQQFEQLDIIEKVQYLNSVSTNKNYSRNDSPQLKLQKQLKNIQKRAKIRQMQDTLYRKLMKSSVRIEGEYQIIESIYNGRKVVQKRKILPKPKKLKNNYTFQNVSQLQQSPDQFLQQFCSSKPPTVQQSKRQFKEQYNIFPVKQINKTLQQEDNLLKDVIIVTDSNNNEIVANASATNRDNLPRLQIDVPIQLMQCQGSDLQTFLTLCGIPFLVAPSQAQAQCASLQLHGIVDAVITDDSDVFLFGAKNVFRGVFQNRIKYYSAQKIQQHLRLDREKMIILALLMGSDYTEGIKGVGIVNAMEIVKVFDSFEKIQTFKKWSHHADILLQQGNRTVDIMDSCSQDEKLFYLLHKRYKNYWFVSEQFPNKNVINAYIMPQVITEEKLQIMRKKLLFQNKQIQENKIEQILKNDFEMSNKNVDSAIKILKKPFSRTKINKIEGNNKILAQIRSKRLQRAINHQS